VPRPRVKFPSVCACKETAWMKGSPTATIIVDAKDADLLQARAWIVDAEGYVQSAGRRPRVKLHRVLLGLSERHLHGDHRNAFRSDCRRDNLRIATPLQNGKNRRKCKKTASQYKGVSWHPSGHWYARIMVDRRCIYLGQFDDEESAAFAYDTAAREHHQEFARTNF